MKRGFSVVEALVALLLTAVALAGLAAARVDGLRAGPRATDRDEVESAGTNFSRTWQVDEDRGGPARLQVEVTWPDGHVVLESEAFP